MTEGRGESNQNALHLGNCQRRNSINFKIKENLYFFVSSPRCPQSGQETAVMLIYNFFYPGCPGICSSLLFLLYS